MTSQRHSKAGEIFLEARGLPEADRAALIERACAGDDDLRREVQSLLEHDVSGDDETLPRETVERAPEARSERRRDERGGDRVIGDYRVLQEIGRGGMGVVYLAVRDSDEFKRPVAIKLLKRGLDTEDVLRRFDLERQVLAALNHTGIARLYDAGQTDDGLPYFVMEYVEGLDLAEYCDKHRLNIDERLALFQKVCAAVHYAHQNLVVHRDLKPRNIVVTEDGQPKLLDFGIAKLIKPELSIMVADPTLPGARVMTPEYASPEQVRGDPISTASDVYTLGVILYELLCGHRPYHLASRVAAEIERVICDVEPARPSTAITSVEEVEEFAPGSGTGTSTRTITPESVSKTRAARPDRLRKILAGDIDNIVMLAMRKESQRRYASAEQMAADIQRYLEGMPVQARPDTLAYRTSKFVRRNRAGVAAAAAIFVLLVAGIIGTTSQWRRAETAKERAVEALATATGERTKSLGLHRQLLTTAETAVTSSERGEGRPVESREQLLSEIVTQLRVLPDPDEETRAVLASALETLGDVLGGHGRENRGEWAAAEECYREALGIRQELAAAGGAEALADLTYARLKMGDIVRQGETPDEKAALEWKRRALDGIATAAQRSGAPSRVRRMHGIALREVGWLLNKNNEAEQCIAKYREAYEVLRGLAAERPDHVRVRRDLAQIAQWLGQRLRQRGDLDEAMRLLKESLEVHEQLVADQPTDRVLSKAERLSRRDLAVALMESGETQLALQELRRCLDPIELAREMDIDAIRTLASAAQELGELLASKGLLAESADAMERSVGLVSIALKRSPNASQGQKQQMVLSHAGVAQTFMMAGEHDRAVEPAESALALATELFRKQEGKYERWDLAMSQWTYAMALAGSGESAKARSFLDQSVVNFERLLTGKDLENEDEDLRRDAAVAYESMSRVLIRRGNELDAIEYARKALTTAPTPTAQLLHTLAEAQFANGKSNEAVKTAREALRLLDEKPPYNAEDLRRAIDESLEGYRTEAGG